MSDLTTWPVLLLGLLLGSLGQEAVAQLEVSGYYKNLLVGSQTLSLYPPETHYTTDLNRVHLRFQGDMGELASFDVQYENELISGNYLATHQFISQKDINPDTYLDLQRTYLDSSNGYGRHRLYRAYVDLAFEKVDIRLGRQRIAWGSALFWSPVDILNPINPTQLERGRRVGVDAVALDWNYGDLSSLSMVYAGHTTAQRASMAWRWRTHNNGFDWALTSGRFRNDKMLGFDFAGQLGKIGTRGEITRTDSPTDGSYTRAVIGADYSFPNTLSLNVEIYYNGQGASDPNRYDFPRLFSGNIQSLAKRYMGGYVSYGVTSILLWRNNWILNLDDHSRFFSPELVVSFSDNVEGSVGIQAFGGGVGSEYGTLKDLYYAYLKWYF